MDGLFLTSRRHWWERAINTVREFHLSETSGLYRARTWTDHMADRDATDCAIAPPVNHITLFQVRSLEKNMRR